MRFMILMCEDPSWDELPTHEQTRIIADHERFESDLRAAGSFVDSARFDTGSAKGIVRLRDGTSMEVNIPDSGGGSIGGYYLIEASDVAEALNWADRCRFIAGPNWVYPVLD